VVVAVVLLIACANVASLLLARAAARAREFSVRSALGAGRTRLVRQLLTESFLLAGMGALLGLLFAQGGTRLLLAFMRLESNPISFSVTPDVRVLVFTIGAALLTGVLFGLAPAIRSSRIDLASAMKGAAGTLAGERIAAAIEPGARRHAGRALARVAHQRGTIRSHPAQSQRHGHGLQPRERRSVRHRTSCNPSARNNALGSIRNCSPVLEALPGVQAASLYGFGLLGGNSYSDRVVPEGHVPAPEENLICHGMWIGPKFFETLGIKVLSGREFTPQDERAAGTNATTPRVAVINETLAKRNFGDVNPLGRRFYFFGRPERTFEIVGVVKDAKYRTLRQEAPPTFYMPFFLDPNQGMTVALRTRGDVRATMASLQSVLSETFSGVRVRNLKTMEDVVNASVHQERVVAQLGGFFSVFALALACLGLYGVLSFAVVQRTREIGVRVALGAQKRNILSLVIGPGVKLALIGAALGILGAFAATRLVSSLLFGVTATDPLTFAGVSLLLVLVAVLASWLPARRATKVDPMEALRYE
jgi:putative ABC transport system permease protein